MGIQVSKDLVRSNPGAELVFPLSEQVGETSLIWCRLLLLQMKISSTCACDNFSQQCPLQYSPFPISEWHLETCTEDDYVEIALRT